MAGWTCFLLKPTRYVRREVRVFCFGSAYACPKGPMPGHDASVTVIEKLERPENPDGYEPDPLKPEDMPEGTPWPTSCAQCGASFVGAHAERQVWDRRLYEGCPDGKLYALHDPALPVGAMWDAWWICKKGPDGLTLMLKCPTGEWWIDGPSSNGGGWSREGTAPGITAHPSIGIGGPPFTFHGWLTAGVLIGDIDGKTFPQHPYTA